MSVAAACGSPAAPRSQAPASSAAAAAPGPCELEWLERAEELTVTERSSGTSGTFAFHAQLRTSTDELAGVMEASFQQRPDSGLRSLRVHVRFPRSEIAGALAAMARAVRAPEEPGPPRGGVRSVEIGRSRSITVEAAARILGVEHRASLQVQRGQDHPLPWLLRGCERVPAHDAREQIAKAYAKLAEAVGRDRTLAALQSSAW